MGAGNPHPEGRAVAETFGGDADVTVAAVGDGTADGEAETGALDEVVELDEAFEDTGLLLGRDAGTGVLTVEDESVGGAAAVGKGAVVPVIAHADVAFAGAN